MASDGESAGGPYPLHRNGSIVRIRMRHFLTYEDEVIYPGPRLNLLLGPNGSGKSSVVCAICIGLGGSPRLLGRARTVGQFIRHTRRTEEKRGFIEIDLKQAGFEMWKIVCKLDGDHPTKATYTANGRPCNAKELRQMLATKFHIQLDNLATFLPQDKVSEFGRMTGVQILDRTIQVCEGEEWLETRKRLTNMNDADRARQAEINTLELAVKTLEGDIERLRGQVKEQEERERLERQWEICDKQERWATVDSFTPLIKQARQSREAAKQALATLRDQLGEMKERVTATAQRHAEAMAEAERAEARRSALSGQVQRRKAGCRQAADAMTKAMEQLANSRTRLEHMKAALGRAQHQLQLLAQESSGDPTLEELDRQLEEAKPMQRSTRTDHRTADAMRMRVEREVAEAKREVQRLQMQLGRMTSATKRRLQAVFHLQPDARKLMEWLQKDDTRGLFQKEVLGPIAIELDQRPECPFALQALENHLAGDRLGAFVAQCHADYRVLRQFADRHRLAVTIHNAYQNADADAANSLRDLTIDERWRRRDVVCALDQALTTRPEASACILALKQLAGIHNVVLCSSDRDTTIVPDIMQQTRKNVVVATPSTYTIARRSRYGGGASESSRDLRPTRVFATTGDDEGETRLRQELEQQQKREQELRPQLEAAAKKASETRQAMAQLDQKLSAIRGRRKEVQHRHRQKVAAEEDVERKEREVAELERQMQDQGATQRVLERAARKRVAVLDALIKHLGELEDATRACDGARIKREKAVREHTAASQRCRDHEAQIAAKQREVAGLDQGVKDAKKEHAAARWRACSTSPLWYCGNAPEGKGEAHPGECFCGPNSGAIEARRAYYVKDVTGSKGQCQAMRMDGSADAVMEVFQHYDLNEAGVYQRILEDLDVKKRGIGDRLAQTSGNPSLRSTLEAKELELEEKRRAHAIKLAESAELQEETTRELQQFNRTVRAVVQSIDTEFQRVFASVGERGNVELDMAEGDVSKYAIHINVSFREGGRLIWLDPSVHSGGEKAVTTMLYLLSMHKVAHEVPFRVVDEINQGMDERNERVVFDHIVESSCRSGDHQPQYFVVTPKLLPGLTYGSGITVLLVLNAWNLRAMVDTERARKGLPAVDWADHDRRCAAARIKRSRGSTEADDGDEAAAAEGAAAKRRRGRA